MRRIGTFLVKNLGEGILLGSAIGACMVITMKTTKSIIDDSRKDGYKNGLFEGFRLRNIYSKKDEEESE